MKAKYFIDKHTPKYCAVVWVMHTTYFTPPITLKREFFDTRAERTSFYRQIFLCRFKGL